ncbi:MAG: dihydrofolate reductase [Bacteroidota bacterium]|nr:dihydrofolate reductase [Candidatus Kapabacteria bacterium]MDW8220870.1 dihydrofolate reductase [Bacteroidota bacterium]
MIAAVASRNYVIGDADMLPWHMPADMQYFHNTTCGHHVIMGRKSFEDIGKPLQQRTNIVVTRRKVYSAEDILICCSLQEAILVAQHSGDDEAFIIGGAQLFAEGLDIADRIYITWIQADVEGDIYFPCFSLEQWCEVSHRDFLPDPHNPYAYSFSVFERRASN